MVIVRVETLLLAESQYVVMAGEILMQPFFVERWDTCELEATQRVQSRFDWDLKELAPLVII